MYQEYQACVSITLEGSSGCLDLRMLLMGLGALCSAEHGRNGGDLVYQRTFLSSFLPSIFFSGQRGSNHSDINLQRLLRL